MLVRRGRVTSPAVVANGDVALAARLSVVFPWAEEYLVGRPPGRSVVNDRPVGDRGRRTARQPRVAAVDRDGRVVHRLTLATASSGGRAVHPSHHPSRLDAAAEHRRGAVVPSHEDPYGQRMASAGHLVSCSKVSLSSA